MKVKVTYSLCRVKKILVPLQSRNTDTEVIRPTKITAINKTSSSSSVMVTAQSSAAAEQGRVPVTSLPLDEIAVQASVLLKDIYSKIFDMRVDFKIFVEGCTSRM